MTYINCYKDIKEGWDKEDPNIDKCCKTERPDEPDCTDSCYSTWRKELKDVIKSYNEQKEASDQIQKELNLISERKGKYKLWLDELTKAEDLARLICHQLEIIAGQTRKVWYSASKATEAVEFLFCMIRKFYQEVDYLRIRYDELLKCIQTNTHPSLEGGKGIVECLKKYFEKLDAITKTRDDIVKLIVEAIKLANLLQNNIFTKEWEKGKTGCDEGYKIVCVECDSKKEDFVADYGFHSFIISWYCEFDCDNNCYKVSGGPCEEKPTGDSSKAGNPAIAKSAEGKRPDSSSSTSKDPCDPDCELVPVLDLPICKGDYKKCLTKWYCDDEKKSLDLSTKLKEKNKIKEGLLACKTSLENAIKEAEIKCK